MWLIFSHIFPSAPQQIEKEIAEYYSGISIT